MANQETVVQAAERLRAAARAEKAAYCVVEALRNALNDASQKWTEAQRATDDASRGLYTAAAGEERRY